MKNDQKMVDDETVWTGRMGSRRNDVEFIEHDSISPEMAQQFASNTFRSRSLKDTRTVRCPATVYLDSFDIAPASAKYMTNRERLLLNTFDCDLSWNFHRLSVRRRSTLFRPFLVIAVVLRYFFFFFFFSRIIFIQK